MMRGLSGLLIVATVAAGAAGAGDIRMRTEIGATGTASRDDSLAANLGYREASELDLGARLMWSAQKGPVSGEVHLTLSGAAGDLVGLTGATAAEVPPATYFDLTADPVDEEDRRLSAAVDRAFVSVASDRLVLTIGRQAITWGAGYFFRPMDVVAPFGPNAIDTSYKPGVDMVYGQVLFDDGSDVQAIWVPRPAEAGGGADPDASTVALYASGALGPIEAHLLLARDRGDAVRGLGLVGPLGPAAWTLEWVGIGDGGDLAPFWLANIANFGTLGGRNISYYVEFHHNGLGVGPEVPLDELPAALSLRMTYGQVFLPGRDFLGLGGTLQLTDEITLAPSVIVSRDDDSAFGTLGLEVSIDDNSDFHADLSAPFGGAGTEFGGREVSGGSGLYATAPRQLVLRYIRYF